PLGSVQSRTGCDNRPIPHAQPVFSFPARAMQTVNLEEIEGRRTGYLHRAAADWKSRTCATYQQRHDLDDVALASYWSAPSTCSRTSASSAGTERWTPVGWSRDVSTIAGRSGIDSVALASGCPGSHRPPLARWSALPRWTSCH